MHKRLVVDIISRSQRVRKMAEETLDGYQTPLTQRRKIDADVFKSPSSESNDSAIDMRFYSFRCAANERRKPIIPSIKSDDGEESLPDNVFEESANLKGKQEYKMSVKLEGATSSYRGWSYDYEVNNLHEVVIKKCCDSNNKLQRFRTPWEAVYAFRQGRKLVKPTFQGRVYNFLERPKEWKSILYHSAIYSSILGTLLLSVLSTVAEDQIIYNEAVYIVEVVLAIVFTTEYVARVWSAGCRGKYVGFWGRLRFITKPICIIDLIIISSSIFVIILGSNGHTFGIKAIRGVRFLQILRMLHVDREGGCWRLLGSVIMEHRQEMFTALYIGFLGLVFSSYFMFLVEKDAIVDNMPSTAFATYADALWWGVVTMMTIGYGDKVPLTWSGRLLACVSALFTVSFFALPAGILGSGFALKVQQQQRQKHFSRQIPVAATLIQTLWRCYAADKNFTSVATWKIHIKTESKETTKYKSTMLALRKKHFEKILKYRSDNEKSDTKPYGEIAVNLEAPKAGGLHQSRSVPDMMISMHDDLMKNEITNKIQNGSEDYSYDMSEENDYNYPKGYTKLTEAHKNAIRAIRKIKYFVAKRKFQQARKPYDVGDVIEQYSQGQISMNVRLKELHRRLDQVLGKSGNHLACKNGKPVTLGEKLQHMEQQIQSMDRKIDNINQAVHTLVRELKKPAEVGT